MKIIISSEMARIEQNRTGEYAVFKPVKSVSGSIMFWQQVSKWYRYYAYAKRIYERNCD